MKKSVQIYGLAALLVLLAYLVYANVLSHSDVPGLPSVNAADTKFQPLDVQEPQLRLDLLARIQKSEYSGSHRNVFLIAPPPPPKPVVPKNAAPPFIGPRVPPPPPPPPPLHVPGEFFGYAMTPGTGRHVAFFKNGDDVQVIAEGDMFLGGFRLLHVSDNSVEVEETATRRHATVPMVQPSPDQNQ